MSKRLDYNQIAPAGAKAVNGVYGYAMRSSLRAVLVARAAAWIVERNVP